MTAPRPQRKHARKNTRKQRAKKRKTKAACAPPHRQAVAPARPRRALVLAAAVATVTAFVIAVLFAERYAVGPGSTPYRPIIERWALEYAVDPVMVAAVLECESSGRVRAVSPSGARGLMQLMPETAVGMAKELGLAEPSPRDLFDPELNIRLGTYYLSKLRKRYGGDRLLTVAAYHAGPTNVDNWRKSMGDPPTEKFIAEVKAVRTRAHVRKVMRRWEKLAGEAATR